MASNIASSSISPRLTQVVREPSRADQGDVAAGARTTSAPRSPKISDAVILAVSGIHAALGWFYTTIVLFDLPTDVSSSLSDLPCPATHAYPTRRAENRWKAFRRKYISLWQSNSYFSTAVLSLGASLLQAPSIQVVPAAVVFIDVANLLSLAGLCYSLILRFYFARARSFASATPWLEQITFGASPLNTPNLLSTPLALTAWSALCAITGVGVSRLGPFLDQNREVGGLGTQQLLAPLVTYTIVVGCLLIHGLMFFSALRRSASMLPSRIDFES